MNFETEIVYALEKIFFFSLLYLRLWQCFAVAQDTQVGKFLAIKFASETCVEWKMSE